MSTSLSVHHNPAALAAAAAGQPHHCLECGTTNTPLWRYGPEGVKSLCNACGIRWKRAHNKHKASGGASATAAGGAGSEASPAKKALHNIGTGTSAAGFKSSSPRATALVHKLASHHPMPATSAAATSAASARAVHGSSFSTAAMGGGLYHNFNNNNNNNSNLAHDPSFACAAAYPTFTITPSSGDAMYTNACALPDTYTNASSMLSPYDYATATAGPAGAPYCSSAPLSIGTGFQYPSAQSSVSSVSPHSSSATSSPLYGSSPLTVPCSPTSPTLNDYSLLMAHGGTSAPSATTASGRPARPDAAAEVGRIVSSLLPAKSRRSRPRSTSSVASSAAAARSLAQQQQQQQHTAAGGRGSADGSTSESDIVTMFMQKIHLEPTTAIPDTLSPRQLNYSAAAAATLANLSSDDLDDSSSCSTTTTTTSSYSTAAATRRQQAWTPQSTTFSHPSSLAALQQLSCAGIGSALAPPTNNNLLQLSSSGSVLSTSSTALARGIRGSLVSDEDLADSVVGNASSEADLSDVDIADDVDSNTEDSSVSLPATDPADDSQARFLFHAALHHRQLPFGASCNIVQQ